ncbi:MULTISPECIES: GerMN domain-containing protein [unclassified Modestobacter]|uniref:GerMN domain-containing protein n=1 Tax=unclassified Modestobacter TaxID=2643866 RepID=UPI0022AA89AA|nr:MULTISPECIES: GerMN domain-containing protein [unclassified Modestobacter]MCZ2811573.1 GerMN domain-containing protein [Modestobacter sp. VKM Ac-2979]MCZ2843296.1 GerMN domain-containing protein [Modestobacter sp. VKM Ac-2980]MCZ2848741.1 GerMN domain-containing protein [Modestobacter sp. VKM Ac-2978]
MSRLRTTRGSERRWSGALLLAGALAGCGVPTGGAPEPIPTSQVPYDLASPSPTATGAPSADARIDEPRVYLVAEDGVLVARGRSLDSGPLEDRLDQLLDDLATGPSASELTDRLSTALRPETSLTVEELSDGTVTIELGGDAQAPAGQESRRAVAQIVLTATSLPEVEAVLLTQAGEPVEAPLPSGELTSRPLSATDYEPLLTPTASPTS